MSGWLEALLGKVLNNGAPIPLSKGLNFTGGLVASRNVLTQHIDVSASASAIGPLLAPVLRGTGMTVESNTLRPRDRPRRIRESDHFLGGTTTSGSIGKLGWNLYSGTWTRSGNVGTSQSTRNRLVSAVAGAGSLGLGPSGGAGTGIFTPSQVDLVQAIVNPISGPTDFAFGFGLSDNADAALSGVADGVGIYAEDGVTNWQAIVRSGSAGSPVDTGVPVALGTQVLLTVQRSGTSWVCSVGNTSVTIASTPTGNVNPSFFCSTADGGTSAELGISYFGIESPIYGGVYSADTFLEV